MARTCSEVNSILKFHITPFLTGGRGNKDAVLYSTFVPCLECSKMAITIGIKKIICLNTYPETDFDLIKESGISIEMLDKNRIQYWAKSLLNL